MATTSGLLLHGTLLQNRYRVIQPLGKGGMGAVYLAQDQHLGGKVALKESFFSHDDELRRQFEREARLLFHLRHPVLPKVIDLFFEGSRQFLVMEFIPGDDLESFACKRGALAPGQVMVWTDRLLDSLHYLHTQTPPIIHRDIKPANLKLTPDGDVHLLDFGLAKGKIGDSSTMLDSVPGHTPAYAPLEQILGKGTDGSSDLYSLAVTTYRLLTGVLPPSSVERLGAISSGLPDPIRPADELNPLIPAKVASVLAKAMSLFREQRTKTAAEMRNGLRQVKVPFLNADNSISIKAGAYGEQLRLWAVVEQTHNSSCWTVAYSPNNDLVASSGHDGVIILYRESDGHLLHAIEGHRDGVWDVSFSPDGEMIASASRDETVRLWETKSGKLLREIDRHNEYGKAVSFSPDGELLAFTQKDKGIQLFEIKSGRVFSVLRGDQSSANSICFSPDGKILASGSHYCLRLWSVNSGQQLWTANRGDFHPVFDAAFSPDGRVIATAEGREEGIFLWDVESGKQQGLLVNVPHSATSLAFSPNGKLLVSSGYEQGAVIWQVRDRRPVRILDKRTEHVNSICLSPNGEKVACTGGFNSRAAVQLFEVKSGNLLWSRNAHWTSIHSINFSQEGNLLAVTRWRRSPEIWNLQRSLEILAMQESGRWVNSICFSPDGLLLAGDGGQSHNKTSLWDVNSGRLMRSLEGPKLEYIGGGGFPDAVSFSPDNALLAAGSGKSLCLWDVKTGRLLKSWEEQQSHHINSVSFSPDGKILASGGNRTVQLWDVRSGDLMHELNADERDVTSVNFSPDGGALAGGGWFDDKVKLWDVRSGKVSMVLTGHRGHINSVSFSPDGELIASGSKDHSIRLWHSSNGKCLAVLAGHLGPVNVVKIAPNNKYLIAAGDAGRLQFWDIKKEETFLYRYDFGPGAWLLLLPDGRFAASPEGLKYLSYTSCETWDSSDGLELAKDFHDPAAIQAVLNSYMK